MTDVCLVSVPFFFLHRPPMGLGLLQAGLVNAGISSKVIYSNFRFARAIGIEAYWFLSMYSQTDLLGEWIFSETAFPGFHPSRQEYLKLAENTIRTICPKKNLEFYLKGRSFSEFFSQPRRKVPEFIESEARRILSYKPRIVGCSSTYQENCASLALLRRIRQLDPAVITMMGGSNCEDVPGAVMHKRFDWVDFVVSGEAELLLPQLCKKIFEKGRDLPVTEMPGGVLGPAHRIGITGFVEPGRSIVENMDLSPVPNFDDYFEELKHSPMTDYFYPGLVFETSRGCWWGEKSQCTFCGFNGKAPAFRSKSPQRVKGDLESLTDTYGLNNYLAVDRILDMDYFNTLLPSLADSQQKYSIMFETKSSLTRQQAAQLAAAGIRFIQPGVEGLHSGILKKLDKGTKSWQNIELLKWTREYGINNLWLMLYGLPDADKQDDWYRETAEIIPLITHLQPPIAVNKIFYLRFSKYFNNMERYKLKLKPFATYNYVYPLSAEDLEAFAYFFEVEKEEGSGSRGKGGGINLLIQRISQWMLLWGPFKGNDVDVPVSLTMAEEPDGLSILDTRPCAVEPHITLSGLSARVYRICDTARSPQKILAELKNDGYPAMQLSGLTPILEALLEKKILLKIEERYLSLAVWASDYKISWHFAGGEIHPHKLLEAFYQNRVEPVQVSTMPADKSLKEIFGS
ncbi:MAG: RiPP maturation radical SAM protein 1 [bacterium]|nr:RiPP maturation radical SAM protein 1 [bacterium]